MYFNNIRLQQHLSTKHSSVDNGKKLVLYKYIYRWIDIDIVTNKKNIDKTNNETLFIFFLFI